jgi:UDP-N-acetylmuramoyl-L-alanyl-D-glutamate--2,6-diaminopimelate ligase
MIHRLTTHQAPVSLRRLFPGASFVGCADVRVVQAAERSDECTADTLFAALPGTQVDGTRYVLEAIARGASSLLAERPLANAAVPQCIVRNARKAYAELCAELAGRPSSQLHLAAVTGTNGKTTVTWLLRSIFRTAGRQTGLLGTIEYHNGVTSEPSTLTTPDSRRLSACLRDMVLRGTTHAAIELSSHALHQDRCAGTLLDAAIITNVTQDHFDYHRSAEEYLDSKARILEHLKRDAAVVFNADDPGSRSIAQRVPRGTRVLACGIQSEADVQATIIDETTEQTHFVLHVQGDRIEVRTPLIGKHNVSNCLAAAAAAHAAGVPLLAIAAGIERLKSVPGRLERVDAGQPFDVFIDYAHTDDALRRCIDGLQSLTAGRVICVFGAGGDRDSSKRPLLGRAAARADLAIVTSDNPRSEHPRAIIHDILAGFSPTDSPLVEIDRSEAIRQAIELAEPGDCVLIAGKGHETEQIIGEQRLPFDDRAVARSILFETLRAAPARPVKIGA